MGFSENGSKRATLAVQVRVLCCEPCLQLLKPSLGIVKQLVAMICYKSSSKRATLAMHASHHMARWLVCMHLLIMRMPAPLHSNYGVWRKAQAACSSALS